jgi:hypothetical protein
MWPKGSSSIRPHSSAYSQSLEERRDARVLSKVQLSSFFHEKFEATRQFGDISEAITTRYDIYFRDPSPGWSERLK